MPLSDISQTKNENPNLPSACDRRLSSFFRAGRSLSSLLAPAERFSLEPPGFERASGSRHTAASSASASFMVFGAWIPGVCIADRRSADDLSGDGAFGCPFYTQTEPLLTTGGMIDRCQSIRTRTNSPWADVRNPPPPGEFRRPIFSKTLYPQLFRSACLHLYRGCVCPGGPIEGRYLPHFRGGGDIF